MNRDALVQLSAQRIQPQPSIFRRGLITEVTIMRHPNALAARRRARAVAVTTTVSAPMQVLTGLTLLALAVALLTHLG